MPIGKHFLGLCLADVISLPLYLSLSFSLNVLAPVCCFFVVVWPRVLRQYSFSCVLFDNIRAIIKNERDIYRSNRLMFSLDVLYAMAVLMLNNLLKMNPSNKPHAIESKSKNKTYFLFLLSIFKLNQWKKRK